MAKRGFFAELNHQSQLADKRRQQAAAASYRAHAAAVRASEQAQRAAERASATAARSSAAEQKQAQKLADQLRVDAGLAEVALLNGQLAQTYAAIDGLLAATLGVDDYVDLETLRVIEVPHPPFDPGPLGVATPELPPLVYPPEPAYQEPAEPKGLGAAFGGKKKHAEAVVQARVDHERVRAAWHDGCVSLHASYLVRMEERAKAEEDRGVALAQAQAQYDAECAKRNEDAATGNNALDNLINDLAFDVPEAIEDYVGIVLANSVYPESFSVVHEYTFDLASRELTLVVSVPEPGGVSGIKEHRYVKAKDEISHVSLSAKEQKDRYAAAVWQVAIRSIHEVFEADRAGKVRSIALTVDTTHIAPATGLPESIPLVVVAAERESFMAFDLSNALPHATLGYLGAALSKSPYDLTPADTSAGVRTRKT
ncbi:MAG: restriction system protein [Kribbellaceae bacterium]|nr:restriction system protein [Kribbellaceae bacterium]